ncbi:ATP-binding protein [Actinomadura sp. 7K507]|uniref:ATP-binding protein n=1 Tax=Actinomadura sp. 7K507 TaxID=2530365 RepID=UPI001404A4EF|nr:ATP-binding protein [Actinomadura sp. 7K507]
MAGNATGAAIGADGELDTTFLAARTAPGQVRTLVEFRLAEWGLARLSGDMALIASELVTNAVEHTPDDREIRVRFTREPGAVLLAVWDSSDGRPVRKRPVRSVAGDAVPDAEALNPGHDDGSGGRGLTIVEALSTDCGVTRTDPAGKWVWARVADGVRR